MKSFQYYQPTEIRFGRGRVREAGELVSRYGKRCLIVTTACRDETLAIYERIRQSLDSAGLACVLFDGVIPNPTTDVVTAGARLAKEFQADVVLGVGGGSSMDTAKAIAVEACHPGSAWDYLYYKEAQPTDKTLPMIAVTTTSGTGSQVTQVAVLTNPELKNKSAIYHDRIYPRACIVDSELMLTVPAHITASTGFDVFCHAFESYLHVNATPYTDLMAVEAIRIVTQYLPIAVENGTDLEAREKMAWADTLAGLCIASAGVTLPHGIGMTIGGYCPSVMHGEALAVVYPEFTRFTYPSAPEQFARVGRMLNPRLIDSPLEEAAVESCKEIDQFMQTIGMWLSLEKLGVSWQDVTAIADHSLVLPDYKNNPRIANRDDIFEILSSSYTR